MRGPGQGEGGLAEENKTDTGFEKTKPPGKLGKGKIVSSWFTKGDPPKGEALSEYSEAYAEYAEEAMDALSKEKIPAAYRDYVRDYFDAIRIERSKTPETPK